MFPKSLGPIELSSYECSTGLVTMLNIVLFKLEASLRDSIANQNF
jgi:hypothetical protein